MLSASRMTPGLLELADPSGRLVHTAQSVHSVHRAAVYLRLGAPDRLGVVAVGDVGGLPGGVLVGGVADFRTLGLKRRGLAIDVTNATTWSPRLPAEAHHTHGPRLATGCDRVRALAAARAGSEGLGPLLGGGDARDAFSLAAAARIAALRAALTTRDPAAAAAEARNLMGLGVGLTPSGDDLLVGLLAALEATGSPMRAALARSIAADAVARTTAIGGSALIHAARGEFAERLHDVLIAIRLDDPETTERAIARATAYGATSGIDTLVGLFLGLEVATADHSAFDEAAA
jgi:Protein of unknown function (DUF2877)